MVRMRRIVGFSRGYSRFVTFMKVVLPIVAVGILALLAAWPTLTRTDQPVAHDNGQLDMLNARYAGTDKQNRPFSIVADNAVKSENEPGVMDLVHPYAEMTENNGTWLAVKAERGRYNEQTGKLLLLGHAQLFQDKGFEFVTDEVHVDVKEGTAWGDRPVTGQGPFGELFSQGFRLFDKGQTIVFTGPARTNLATKNGVRMGR
jgi:lipopolysaccharide export system protein LptC